MRTVTHLVLAVTAMVLLVSGPASAQTAIEAVADQALLRGTGARGLRAILEEVLQQVMFDVPSEQDIAKVVITRDVVLDNVNPTIVRREAARVVKRAPRRQSA